MSTKVNVAAEGILTYGKKGVSDWQLLSCLGISEQAAKDLLTLCGSALGNIAKMDAKEMTAIKGITTNKAATIIAAIELGRRRQIESAMAKKKVESSLDTYDILIPLMRDLTQEEMWVVFMDRRCQVIAFERIHQGGMAAMVVDVKCIFQRALIHKATAIIVSHNHPSGAPSPSIEDIRITEKINSAGKVLDIKLLDHIIIGDGSYYSFADEGKIYG